MITKFDNKIRESFLRIGTNPALLSLIISLVIIFTLPPIFNKYNASIIKEERHEETFEMYYVDLDDDGISEKIVTLQSSPNNTSILVYKNDKVIDQWNFIGYPQSGIKVFCGDIDGDELKEIFLFTIYNNGDDKNRTLFLHCVNPISKKILFKNKNVVTYTPYAENFDCKTSEAGFYDKNGDGTKEFYFSTEIGYALSPREFFIYDLVVDTVYHSPANCAQLKEPLIFDLENSGKVDFIYATFAAGNCDINAPYSDMYSWLMVFTTNATLKYKPFQIGFYPSYSMVIPFIENKENYLVVLNVYQGVENHDCSITLFSASVEKLKEQRFPYSPDWSDASLYYNVSEKPDHFYIVKKDGSVQKRNKKLEIIDIINFPVVHTSKGYRLDIDDDGSDEIIFQSEDLNNLIFTRNNFSDYIFLNCGNRGALQHCSIKLNGTDPPELHALFPSTSLFIRYNSNPYFYLRYPLYFLIYGIVFLLIILIQKGQKHRVEVRHETEKKIAELQIKAIKNQLDPHFTLNIINSIGSLFHKHDNEKADYIFGKYSKLLRSTILNSDKIVTTLLSELDYVQNYLELEKFRHDNSFNWKINTDDNINTEISIPKMLIHTFVENSVKHGLRHRNGHGEITIAVSGTPQEYIIRITDNGIGRDKAKEFSFESTGKGLTILDQMLDLYFNLMDIRITYTVNDLTDNNGTITGTEVVITIPILLRQWNQNQRI